MGREGGSETLTWNKNQKSQSSVPAHTGGPGVLMEVAQVGGFTDSPQISLYTC